MITHAPREVGPPRARVLTLCGLRLPPGNQFSEWPTCWRCRRALSEGAEHTAECTPWNCDLSGDEYARRARGYTSEDEPTTDMTRTVYLIAQPTLKGTGGFPKLDSLPQWGTLKVLLRAGEDPRVTPARCLRLIRSRLNDFDHARDCLVWAGGDTLAALLTGVVLMDFACDEEDPFDTVRWLRWERAHGEDGQRTDDGGHYELITVPLFSGNDSMVSPTTTDHP